MPQSLPWDLSGSSRIVKNLFFLRMFFLAGFSFHPTEGNSPISRQPLWYIYGLPQGSIRIDPSIKRVFGLILSRNKIRMTRCSPRLFAYSGGGRDLWGSFQIFQDLMGSFRIGDPCDWRLSRLSLSYDICGPPERSIRIEPCLMGLG